MKPTYDACLVLKCSDWGGHGKERGRGKERESRRKRKGKGQKGIKGKKGKERKGKEMKGKKREALVAVEIEYEERLSVKWKNE